MASRINRFQGYINANQGETNKNWITDSFGNVVEWAGNYAEKNPEQADIAAKAASIVPSLLPGLGPIIGGLGVAGNAAVEKGWVENQLPIDPNAPGAKQIAGAVAPIAGSLAALELGQRGLNTGIGGSFLIAGGIQDAALATVTRSDTFINPNPLFRDGFTFDDVTNTYAKFWNDEVTAGQAIATTVGRSGLNVVDFMVPGDQQEVVDNWVLEETKRQLSDPQNMGPDGRQLLGWNVGLYSSFDVFDTEMRESAYNQGLGRWITGSSDAAIQWWAGPDVLAAKATGYGFRTLFVKSFDSLSDLNKMQDDLVAQMAFDNGQAYGQVLDDSGNVLREVAAKKTALGQLVKSLTKMNEQQVLRHKIAKNSTDAPLVARVFGQSTTFEGTAMRLRAMAGDRAAVKQLFDEDALAADALGINMERADYLKSIISQIDSNATGPQIDEAVSMLRGNVDEIEAVIAKAKEENQPLREALDAFNREAYMPDKVRLGKISVSKLDFGPNSVFRMENAAVKEAARRTGQNYWTSSTFKTGGTWGRTVRVWQAGSEKWKSFRQNGLVNLNDPNDLLAEIDAGLNTPMFRRLLKKFGNEARLPQLNPETGKIEYTGELVTEFKARYIQRVIDARTPEDRYVVIQQFNQAARRSLSDMYGISNERAQEIVQQYAQYRNEVHQQVLEHGWVKEMDGTIEVARDLQSLLAERAIVDDLDFLDTIFRIEEGSGFAKAGLRGNGVLAKFDAVWRPLVLLRLGYTQRNVAEGWLRELAMYGTLGLLKDRQLGTLSADDAMYTLGQRMSDTATSMAAVARRLKVGSVRRTTKDLRDYQTVLRARSAAAKAAAEERDNLERKMYDYRSARFRKMQDELLSVDRERMAIGTDVVWEEIDDAARARATEWVDNAQEIIIPVDFMYPIVATGPDGARRANAFVGIAGTEDDVVSEVVNSGATGPFDNMLDDAGLPDGWNENDLRPWMTRAEQAQMDELEPQYFDVNGQIRSDVDAQVQDLAFTAYTRLVRANMEQGNLVYRIEEPMDGYAVYERIFDEEDITLDDMNQGVLSIAKREDVEAHTKFVRAKTYGETIDLRPDYQRAQDRFAKYSEGPAAEDSLTPEQNLNWQLNFAADIYRMLGDENAAARVLDADEDDILFIDELLDYINNDPEFATNLGHMLWVNSLDEGRKAVLERAGALKDSDQLKYLLKKFKQDEKRRAELRGIYDQQADEIRAQAERYAPMLGAMGSDLSKFHGGTKVEGDALLPNPVKPDPNDPGAASMGIGAYFSDNSGVAGGGYIAGKPGDMAFGRAVSKDGVPVVYAMRMDRVMEQKFVDLDETVDNPELEDWLRTVFQRMQDEYGDDIDFDDAWDEVDTLLMQKINNEQFPLDPLMEARTTPENVNDFREVMIDYFNQKIIDENPNIDPSDANYQAQMLWVQAVRQDGALGVRHIGGKNMGDVDHNVFIWYGDGSYRLPMENVENLSGKAVALQSVVRKITDLMVTQDAAKNSIQMMQKFAKYDWRRFDWAYMPAGVKEKLARELSTDSGIGRFAMANSDSPQGWSWLVNPETAVVGADSTLDEALPGALLGQKWADQKFTTFIGEEATRHPAVWMPGNMQRDQLLQMFQGDEEAVRILLGESQLNIRTLRGYIKDESVMGPKAPIKAELEGAKAAQDIALARIVRYMDENGYTHLGLGSPENPRFLSISEMIGRKRTGATYRSGLDRTDVDDMTAYSLANDVEYQKMVNDLEQLEQEAFNAEDVLAQSEERARQLSLKLESITRVSKRGERAKRRIGRGNETIVESGGGASLTTEGPLNINNQGELYAALTSSDNTNTTALFGYADRGLRNLKRTQQEMDYGPNSPMYWPALARQINMLYRNDPVAMRIMELGLPINAPLSEIAPYLDEIILDLRKTKRGRAWLRDVSGADDFKGMIPGDQLTEDSLQAAREIAYGIYEKLGFIASRGGVDGKTSQEFLQRMFEGEVSATWLQKELGWRSDLPVVRDFMYVDPNDTRYRKFVSTMMRKLGTTPENALVRHPFYRARWREEMQRQVDLYAEQKRAADPTWDGTFSQDEINAMQGVAKSWGVQQVQQNLYTIMRLSTPAYMFRFIVPFFPAWASAMRFWLLRLPMEKPESVVRYAMAFNAPENIGMVQNDKGETVDPTGQNNGIPDVVDNIFAKVIPDSGNTMVIQLSPGVAEKVSGLLGGQDTIKVSKGSLDFLLQGDYFWLPGFGPLVTIPVQWLASQKPDMAASLESGVKADDPREILNRAGGVPWTDTSAAFAKFFGKTMATAVYKSGIPFGVTKDKEPTDLFTSQVAPPWFQKVYTAIFMNDAQFSNTANAMYRNEIIEWEKSGRVGPEPDFNESINQARVFFLFRGLVNLTAPFAPSFDSKFKFYIDEWRSIEQLSQDAYAEDPNAFMQQYGSQSPYDLALDTYLNLYGDEFYAATKSLSGNASGMGPNVGEYQAYMANSGLAASMADLGAEGDSSLLSIMTAPFEKVLNEEAGYDQSVYAWQFDRPIQGAQGKFIRESSKFRENMMTDINVEQGWREFDSRMGGFLELMRDPTVDLDAMYGDGFTDALEEVKREIAVEIGAKNRDWLIEYNEGASARWMRASDAIDMMLADEDFQKYADKVEPIPADGSPMGPIQSYIAAMRYWQESRKELQFTMIQLASEAGVAASLDGKYGDIYSQAYNEIVRQAMAIDPYGNFANVHSRFFSRDPLVGNAQVVRKDAA